MFYVFYKEKVNIDFIDNIENKKIIDNQININVKDKDNDKDCLLCLENNNEIFYDYNFKIINIYIIVIVLQIYIMNVLKNIIKKKKLYNMFKKYR